MKNLKQVMSILLVLILMFSLWPPAHAAEGEGIKLSVTASRSSVKVDETVVLSIRADRSFSSRGSGMTVCYDAEKLEPDLEGSCAAVPLQIHKVTVNGEAALRISFLPGLEPAAFSASEALAEIRFKALGVTAQTSVSLGEAYFYDPQLTEILLERPEAVDLSIAPAEVYIPVTGITLDQTELTVEEGEMEVLKAAVKPLGASDPAVIWTSSDESVAIVSGGVVKALTEGTAAITAATKDGGFTAVCNVTVKAPDAGYTAKMPADTVAAVGGTVQIPVVIGNRDGKTGYNAFDISFTYDPSALELISTALPGVTVTAKDGRINVLGYGGDRHAGSIPFILVFKALKMGATEVRLNAARVDNSGNAVVKNASLATLIDDTASIAVTGYPVTLPEGFRGANTAAPGEDYTFSVPEDHYDYTVSVAVGGKEAAVTKNSDGSYTVPSELVTGEITVTAARTGRTFSVTLGTDMTGAAAAQYGTDYVAVINRDESFRYTVTVTVGGREYTGYAASGKTYTIPGTDITGEIVFHVTKTKISKPSEPVTMHAVTFTGSAAGAAQGNVVSAAHGGTYTLTLKQQAGYSYSVSYRMGGRPAAAVSANPDGTYTIGNVTAPLEIIIERTLNVEVSVQEFVTLDEKSAFLILADAALAGGSAFACGGDAMYYCEAYGAWAYLVITDQDLTLDEIRSQVRIVAQDSRMIPASDGDIDGNQKVNWDDAQLVRDLYNAKHDSFDSVPMMKFLCADVNGDRKLDIRDTAWIAWNIWESERE